MLKPATVLLISFCAQAHAESSPALQSPRLAALATSDTTADKGELEKFWVDVDRTHTPLIEVLPGDAGEMLVTFLWRAAPDQQELNVGVLSPLGETYKARAVPEAFARVPETDVWYRTYRASTQARFEYALTWPQGREANAEAHFSYSHDGITYEAFPDPRNPKTMPTQWDEKGPNKAWVDRVRRVSYAEGPDAPAEPFVAERSDVARGKVTTTELASELLGNTRRISIYTPPGLDGGCARCDFLLVFDRAEYVLAVPMPTILDNMQADGVLRPIVAVFVGNAPDARSVELPANARFQDFVQRELLPWVRERYRFTSNPNRMVVAGSSYGGLASAFAGLKHSQMFGNVLSQSGSYWWWPNFQSQGRDVEPLNSNSGWLIHEYANTRKLPLRFYLDVGSMEGSLMLLPNRMFRDVLRARGYEVTYREFTGAHDYIMWRSTISEGLIALIGSRRK